MTHDALRPSGEPPPDLGFFTGSAAPAAAAPSGGVFGTPVAADVPFGTVPRMAEPAPTTRESPIRGRTLLLAGLLVVALVGSIGVFTVRAWKGSGTAPQTTVATPPLLGSLSRTALAAPDLARLQPDLATAVRLRPLHLATYTSGPVSAQVLVALPVTPMAAATQSQVLTALTAGLERITGIPPQLAPVIAGTTSLLSPFGCSQIELGSETPVFCAGTSSGSVTLMLVSGEDYAAATHTAADLRAGVVHRG